MSEMQALTRVEARRLLEAAAYGSPMPVPADMTELGTAKLLLAGATLKRMPAEAAVAIGVYLERYERMLAVAQALSEALERGNPVDMWRHISTIKALAREDGDGRDTRPAA